MAPSYILNITFPYSWYTYGASRCFANELLFTINKSADYFFITLIKSTLTQLSLFYSINNNFD